MLPRAVPYKEGGVIKLGDMGRWNPTWRRTCRHVQLCPYRESAKVDVRCKCTVVTECSAERDHLITSGVIKGTSLKVRSQQSLASPANILSSDGKALITREP